jgi:tetratricopeptide (TPR) repeat protein
MADEPLPAEAEKLTLLQRVLRIPQTVRGLPAAAMQHRVLSFLALVATVCGITLGSAMAWRRISEDSKPADQKGLSLALSLLDDRQFGRAHTQAKELTESGPLVPKEAGGPPFVLGAVAAYEAASVSSPSHRKRIFLLAAEYLEESQNLGFPEGRRTEGILLLARSLFNSGQFAKSLPVLHEALKLSPDRAVEMERLLAEAYLMDTEPNLKQSSKFVSLFLAHESLSARQRQSGLLLRARNSFALGHFDDCTAAVAQIPTDSSVRPEAIVLEGRLLMAEAEQLDSDGSDPENAGQATEKYRTAIGVLSEVQTHRLSEHDARRVSSYLIGVALHRLNDLPAAQHQLARTVRLYFDMDEGIAASLEEGKTLKKMGEHDAALDAFRRTLAEADSADTYRNRWVPLEELHSAILNTYQNYFVAEKYDVAIRLAEAMSPSFSRSRSLQLKGEAQIAWANQLLKSAENRQEQEQLELQKQARQKFRDAGHTYYRLSAERMATPYFPTDVWTSADSFLRGNDFEHAAEMFYKYLEHDVSKTRARALTGLGDALRALERNDEAIEAYTDCVVQFPKDPMTYYARLQVARVLIDKGDLKNARLRLLENLQDDQLTPDSIEWQESLFTLGKLQYQHGNHLNVESRSMEVDPGSPETLKARLKVLEKSHAAFRQAIDRLSEAVDRYPKSPHLIDAHYLIGQAYRHAARLPEARMETVTIETTRIALNKERQTLLAAALREFEVLQQMLRDRQVRLPLSRVELGILRNCYFLGGSILYDMGQYENSIQAYSTATNRYQQHPTSIETFVQISSCYRRLNRPREARRTVEQAKVVLNRIDDRADFNGTTRYSHEEWQRFLDWLSLL